MTRGPLGDGRRETLGCRVSAQLAAKADQARGELERSEWLRRLVTDAIAAAELPDGTDWERRARTAERKLAAISAVLDDGPAFEVDSAIAELKDYGPDRMCI